MPAVVCPRCREPYAGAVGSGWLSCQRCQHRWLPTAMPVSASSSAIPAATAVPTAPDLPPLPSAPAASSPVAPAARVSIHDSDEYAPNETAALKARNAPLTNRQTPAAGMDPAPAATPIAAGTDPFDPDLFERMARDAQRNRKSSEIPPAPALPVAPPAPPVLPVATPVNATAAPKERTVASRPIGCPVCGHSFSSDRPDDQPQVCPQCRTSFNLAKGHVVSGGAKSANGDALLGHVLRGCLIDRKVGEGGMGSVYHARQLSLERSVAIKVLPPELARNRNFISRFEREAKSLARINHPNILHIYDFGEDQQLGIYFMIIEFVEGRDLGDMLHESYTLGQIEVIDILRQAALGLEQAAEKGVIHRDIKPDNLMMTKEGICKVSDFGLAKATTAEKDVTTIGVRVGTPAFMSPEQCDGDDVDFRSDIYNLGCTAFLALTGQLPYDADTPFAIMLKHKNDPVPSPRSFNPNLDARVESLVMRMIAKRPADRFDTLRELVEMLEDLEVKLAGTATILRKTRGPFRAMSEVEAVEHARLTSTGLRNPETQPDKAVDQLPIAKASPVPAASAARTPAPIGPGAVPEWLKPVAETKPRKTTSSLQAMPTPRPAPQAGTTSQREMKDLRSKLTEARQRNMQDEAHALVAEGDRLAANGQYAQAADRWTRASTMTPNAAEAQSLLQRATRIRRGRGFARMVKLLLIVVLLLAGLGAGAFYGVPVGHNLLADREVASLRAINAPQARLVALESFIATYGKPPALYVTVFKQGYPVLAADQAIAEIAALKIQLTPPPPKPQPAKPTKADEEMVRLESLRDDTSVPWLAVANEARRVVIDGEAKDRARAIMEQAERHVAEMAADYEAIRNHWSAGRQGQVAALSAAFRAKHQRAGAAAPAALPARIEVVDGDNGRPPANVQIATRVQVVDGGDRGVMAGESRLAVGESVFCRYPRSPVVVEVSAPGYRTERLVVAPDPDPAEKLVRVQLRPGEAWRAQVARSPRWLGLTPLPGTPFALVRTPEHLALVRLSSGELRSPITRSQAAVPAGAEGAFWTDCLDPRAGGFTVGTTDGLALELLMDDGSIRLGALIHRTGSPLLASIDKELTFQAKRAVYAISSVEQGLVLSAHTPDKDLWQLRGLAGFQRPVLWAQDDRILVLDDRQLQVLDEADGHVVAQRALPGARTGVPLRVPDSQLLVVPTTAGAVLMRVVPAGTGAIGEVDDKVLNDSRARLLAQDGATFLAVAQDRSVSLLAWNGSAFAKTWGATLPTDAGAPAWVTLTPDLALIGDDRGMVIVLSRKDGTLQRRLMHPAALLSAPILADGRIVVADREGNLVAYHLPPLP
jgi:serine/threonine protein kinase